MNFDQIYLKEKIILLLSDYSINTVLNLAQQSGNLWMSKDNTTTSLPITIDTNGLGLFVPELSKYFKGENYNCTLKVGVFGKHRQPIIKTQDDGSLISLNFGIKIDVHNESTPYDDAFFAVDLNVDFDIKVKFIVDSNDLFSVQFGVITAKNISAISYIGDIDTQRSLKILESLVKAAITQSSGDMRNINIVEKLYSYTGITFYNIVIDSNEGYHAFTLNYKNE